MKRSGIITIDKRIIIEIIGTENIESLVGVKGKILASEELIEGLVKEANRKMEVNLERIEELVGKLERV